MVGSEGYLIEDGLRLFLGNLRAYEKETPAATAASGLLAWSMRSVGTRDSARSLSVFCQVRREAVATEAGRSHRQILNRLKR